jgi:hypothetical protein
VPLVTIAQARITESGGHLRIRGVVTLPTGLIEEGSGVVADPSGAILVRTGDSGPRLRRGQLVELIGVRSTKAGMLSLRVTQSVVLGTQAEPPAVRRATGRIGEEDEALLVVVRGLVGNGPRRTSGGGLSFTVDDGTGALRVFVAAASGITARQVPGEAWIELRAIVGQQTTGAEPNAGYRLWPRDRSDVRLIATTTPSSAGAGAGAMGESAEGETLTATPGPSLKLIRPSLAGSAIGVLHGAGRVVAQSAPRRLPPSPVPLAAGIGGIAGLAVLAWRHGTWGRLQVEMERRMAVFRPGANAGDEEDDAYTPAP